MNSNRITLRLPEDVLHALQSEAGEKNLSLNALVTNLLYKTIISDLQLKMIPNITISNNTLLKIIENLDEVYLKDIVKEGPLVIKKLFKILCYDYELDNIIKYYFSNVGKHWGWYTFSYSLNDGNYHLVFKTTLGEKWVKYLTKYVLAVLDSIENIRITEKFVDDDSIVFGIKEVKET